MFKLIIWSLLLLARLPQVRLQYDMIEIWIVSWHISWFILNEPYHNIRTSRLHTEIEPTDAYTLERDLPISLGFPANNDGQMLVMYEYNTADAGGELPHHGH